MATFDQLPAEQRAILELVLQRRQSYDDLSSMLGMPTARVRQLAREALTDLASRSAARVDPDWRGQVADYMLGQQTGPEGTATRGHMRRSEAARLWALSLLDSLEHLYDEADMPIVPEGDAAPTREPLRERRPLRERAPRRDEREEPDEPEEPDERPRARPLSADAEAVVRRRRIAGGAAAATVVLFALLVWPIGLLGGDGYDDNDSASVVDSIAGGDGDGDGDDTGATADQPEVVGQLLLRPQSGEKGVGIALITESDAGERSLLIQARGLKPTPSDQTQAYEVWLFNGQDEAQSMGAQLTDRQGNYQGAGTLPGDYESYEFLDISRESVDQNAAHSGDSVLRGRLSEIQAATEGGGQLTPEVPPAGE
ncbi:MAG TPA: anti-sigma factor [Thermoleophilaceae bacterium]|nr:anti-sigma factor [Thermoleophilaceae bacterium]